MLFQVCRTDCLFSKTAVLKTVLISRVNAYNFEACVVQRAKSYSFRCQMRTILGTASCANGKRVLFSSSNEHDYISCISPAKTRRDQLLNYCQIRSQISTKMAKQAHFAKILAKITAVLAKNQQKSSPAN